MSTKTGNTTDFTTVPAFSALAGTDAWPSGYDEIHYAPRRWQRPFR